MGNVYVSHRADKHNSFEITPQEQFKKDQK